jgi:hypothetical protein
MSSGDEDSKDQQVCQTSTWLHFSLQTGGMTTHYSHDKGDTKRRHVSTHGNAVQQGASIRPNVFVPFVLAPRFGAAILLTQSVWVIFDR